MRQSAAGGTVANVSIIGSATDRSGSNSSCASAAPPRNAPVTSTIGRPRSGSGTSGIGGRQRKRTPEVSSAGAPAAHSR